MQETYNGQQVMAPPFYDVTSNNNPTVQYRATNVSRICIPKMKSRALGGQQSLDMKHHKILLKPQTYGNHYLWSSRETKCTSNNTLLTHQSFLQDH